MANSYYKNYDRLQKTFTLPSQASSRWVFQSIYGRKKSPYIKVKLVLEAFFMDPHTGMSQQISEFKPLNIIYISTRENTVIL